MSLYDLRGTQPSLGRNVFVAETATVIGDVYLGDEASIWFGAVIRADYRPIRIGARTNVQDNAVVHITSTRGPGGGTIVGDDVVVGHGAVLHACTVGSTCLIGIGAIVLDGAVIGDGSLVAAGSLVTPGAVIPPRSFVLGSPAKPLRTMSDEEVADIRDAAAKYVGFAQDFRAGCRAL
jgi:carbonic anhydrase/acetyltransferase-like protein (isoleucine patch superfamily)